jgi:hypothetical protein
MSHLIAIAALALGLVLLRRHVGCAPAARLRGSLGAAAQA